MHKSKNASVWTEQGYVLFAEKGLEGIQVERLARTLGLNKSGFYHYFGDMEVYWDELLRHHNGIAEIYFDKIRHVKKIDPDWFEIPVEFKVATMVQMQLLRSKNPTFCKVAETVNHKEDAILRELISEYLGYRENPDLAMRYYDMLRYMFYTRASLDNLTCEFLRNLVNEAKAVVHQLAEDSSAPSA